MIGTNFDLRKSNLWVKLLLRCRMLPLPSIDRPLLRFIGNSTTSYAMRSSQAVFLPEHACPQHANSPANSTSHATPCSTHSNNSTPKAILNAASATAPTSPTNYPTIYCG